MKNLTWHGVTRSETLKELDADRRRSLVDAAKSNHWAEVIRLLSASRELVNAACLDDPSLFSPLHYAASAGASVEIVRQIVDYGAWRTLKNGASEKPLDLARKLNHQHLYAILEPVLFRTAPADTLHTIQNHFHDLVRQIAGQLVEKHALRLPQLEPLLELPEGDQIHFAIPGMYGGFSYQLQIHGADVKLLTSSWSRVVEGSGQRHEITTNETTLVEEGFV